MTKDLAMIGAPGALAARLGERLRESVADERWRTAAPSEEELAALGGGDTWVYAAPAGVGSGATPDLDAAARVFDHAVRGRVGHLVLVSSAAVNEPSAHHPGMVSEARLARRRLGNAVAASWLELERLARDRLAGTETVLTVLRPTAVPVAGGDDPVSHLFARRLALTPLGFDPTLQVLSPDDLAAAIGRAVEQGSNGAGAEARGGTFNVAPAATIPLRKALRAAGGHRLPVPHGLRRLARRVRGAATDPLEYLRYPWTVSGEEIRSRLGFTPARTSAQAIAELSVKSGRAGRRPSSPAAMGEHDDFGMDKDYIARLGRTLFRFLHDVYWRVEWRGLEHVPRHGRGVLAGIHRGHQPWDGVMTLHLLAREIGRYPRFLVHPTLVKFPFLAPYMTKLGGLLACRENADWVLEREGLAGIYPEGIRGAFARYKNVYKLRKFGRDEFVKIALRNRAPIIPFVTVGSAEIFPILAKIDWRWWKRVSEWPAFPITPTMGLVPLPSKWHTRFLEPIDVEEHPPEAAGDRAVVKAISLEVRRRMEAAIADMLARRKRIFWGSVFDGREPAQLEETPA